MKKEELKDMIENGLADETGKITGNNIKNVLKEIVDAMGEGGGASQMEYWGIPEGYEMDVIGELCGLLVLGKFSVSGQTLIASAGFAGILPEGASVAFAFDPNIKMAYPGLGVATAKEIVAHLGITDLSELGLTPIDEDDFYTI